MIRSLWVVLSVMAIANLLALGGFLGWLQMSNRLNRDRVEKARMLFAQTLADEQMSAEQKAADEAAAAQAAEAAAQVGTPPLNSESRLAAAEQQDQAVSQQAQRVQRETSDLIKTLLQEREDLERARAEFQKQVDDFEMLRKRIAEEEGTEQFQKAVQLYQSLKPEQSKNMMESLIKAGAKDQVVSYLDALAPRISAKIISEFEKTDPALAADLLENLRTRGVVLAGTGGANPEGP